MLQEDDKLIFKEDLLQRLLLIDAADLVVFALQVAQRGLLSIIATLVRQDLQKCVPHGPERKSHLLKSLDDVDELLFVPVLQRNQLRLDDLLQLRSFIDQGLSLLGWYRGRPFIELLHGGKGATVGCRRSVLTKNSR